MQDFILTKDQSKALEVIYNRYLNGFKHVVVSGAAGVGKTTLVKIAIDKLVNDFNIRESQIIYCSFTGKAANVLRQKGNSNVSTLHKLLYIPVFNQYTGQYEFMERTDIEDEYRIIVCDECSMIPGKMVDLLAKTNSFIMFLGDNSQLPPIDKESSNNLLENPHVTLTEIVRQAQDSEIIKVATMVREGKKLQPFDGKDVKIIRKSDLTTGMLLWADQVLCSKNDTRRELNNLMRSLLGFETTAPQENDKVICLHNYWDIFSKECYPLMNGTIGYLRNPQPITEFFRKYFTVTSTDILTENDDSFDGIKMDTKLIETGVPTLSSKEEFAMKKNRNRKVRKKIPLAFDYGYAITVHKAQGSQWNKVLVLEEDFPYSPLEHKQSLYTAITRAVDKLIIVLKD